MGSKQMTEYTIMDIEKVSEKERRKFAGQGAISKKVTVATHCVQQLAKRNPKPYSDACFLKMLMKIIYHVHDIKTFFQESERSLRA